MNAVHELLSLPFWCVCVGGAQVKTGPGDCHQLSPQPLGDWKRWPLSHLLLIFLKPLSSAAGEASEVRLGSEAKLTVTHRLTLEVSVCGEAL
jgi:hypothetical protein